MIKINPAWSEPNGSWKSFVYKMVHNSDFRGDVISIVLLYAFIGGTTVTIWTGHWPLR